MKAEHRKELQTNALADFLGRLIVGYREGFKIRPSHTLLLIVGGIVLVLVAVISISLYRGSVSRGRSAEWVRLDEASTLKDLEGIAAKSSGDAATRVARFQLARVYLRRGMENFCSTADDGRKEAIENLNEAARLYGDLAAESKDNAVLVQEALLGVGKAKEALNELDDALAAYQDLVKRYPNSVNGKAAAERVKKLSDNKEQVSAFYKELDKLAAPIAPTPKKDESKSAAPITPTPKKDESKSAAPIKTTPKKDESKSAAPITPTPKKDESKSAAPIETTPKKDESK
jgi:hypothetical protein